MHLNYNLQCCCKYLLSFTKTILDDILINFKTDSDINNILTFIQITNHIYIFKVCQIFDYKWVVSGHSKNIGTLFIF